MKPANIIRGRIESHGEGIGTPDEDSVRVRAREIAMTNGRRAEEFNKSDLDQARQELAGAQSEPTDGPEEFDEVKPGEGVENVSSGKAAPTKMATDEQMLTVALVEEGVEEAAHDEMVEGNAESRRRDEAFEDQLPSTTS